MLSKFLGCGCESNTVSSTYNLKQAVEELKEKEAILEKKMLTEAERAKEFAKENNRRAAMQCLRKKKLYSGHIERVQSFRMRLHSQEKIQRNISNRYNRDMHKVLS